MKKTEGAGIEICLEVINTVENQLKPKQKPGDATEVVDSANKPIEKDMPTIDVKVGTHECGKKGNVYYRFDNNGNYEEISFADVTIRLKQRGIGNSQETIDR